MLPRYGWILLLGVLFCQVVSATAAPMTADLSAYYATTAESGPIALDSGAAATWFSDTYGLSFRNAYLYTGGTGQGTYTGIANATQYGSTQGLVIFEDSTDFVTVDWLTVDTREISLVALNAQGVVLDSFSYVGAAGSSGHVTLNGSGAEAIYALRFHDNGGTVGLTSLSYDYGGMTAPVPEPATMTLMACGLFFLSWRWKRVKRLSRRKKVGLVT